MYLTIIEYTKLMKNVSILVMSLLLIPFIQYVYAGSPGIINEDLGAFTFHTESDDNANISYAPSYGNFSNLTQEDIVVGQSDAVNNTIASVRENSNSTLSPVDPFQDYKTKASDWDIEVGTDPNLTGNAFATNLSKQ